MMDDLDPAANKILQKLQELQDWQRKQQERLLQQQRDQREVLSKEQRRIYEVFGLGTIAIEGKTDPKVDISNVQPASRTRFNPRPSSDAAGGEVVAAIEGVEPLPETDTEDGPQTGAEKDSAVALQNEKLASHESEISLKKNVSLDEVPIASPRRDFMELLEEKLKSDTVGHEGKATNVERPKKSFLKKGEGLARFRLRPSEKQPVTKRQNQKKRPSSAPKPVTKSAQSVRPPSRKAVSETEAMKPPLKSSVRASSSQTKNEPKGKPPVPCGRRRFQSPNPRLVLKTDDASQATGSSPTWAQVLLKQPQAQDGTKHSREAPSGEEDRHQVATHDSVDDSFWGRINDVAKKNMKELEELHIFELLEQAAADSSFCSTSSLVTKLMENSIRSTPKKHPDESPNVCGDQRASTRDGCPPREVDAFPHKENEVLASGGQSLKVGYLPYGTDLTDSETDVKQYLSIPKWVNAFIAARMNNISQDSDRQRKEITTSKPSANLPEIDHETNQPGDSSMHVRFADVNEKHVYNSEIDSFPAASIPQSTQIDILERDDSTPSPRKNRTKDNFRDSEAWSDTHESSDETSSSDNSDECNFRSRKVSTANSISVQTDTNNQYSDKIIETLLSPKEHAMTAVDDINEVPEKLPSDRFYKWPLNKHTTDAGTDPKDLDVVFKSSLLRTRLSELENEIEIFQRENENLRKLKKQYEENNVKLRKEKLDFESYVADEEKRIQNMLQEEKKKLARDKQVFEKYCKTVKNQPSKREREEIQGLKDKLSELQDEMRRKECRWNAAQNRARERQRTLERENYELKEEVNRLKREKQELQKVKAVSGGRGKLYTSSDILDVINRHIGQIDAKDMENAVIIREVIPRGKIPESVLSQGKQDAGKKESNKKGVKAKQTNGVGNISTKAVGNPYVQREVPNHSTNLGAKNPNLPAIPEVVFGDDHSDDDDDVGGVGGPANRNSTTPSPSTEELGCNHDKLEHKATSVLYNAFFASEFDNESSDWDKSSESDSSPEEKRKSPENPVPSVRVDESAPSENQSKEMIYPDGYREKVYPSGCKEIWYPNGNCKKISANGNHVKMIYYNGDVKETLPDGLVKYYYSETQTWHTTYPDGLEVLEFPNGQVERRQKDGTIEVTFPNGSACFYHIDGTEEFIFPDGLVMKKLPNGDKVLEFRNGQKEFHTKEHKRREYPDGTVKILYPDGQQETRYANGRVRLKDSSGNLVVDSGG